MADETILVVDADQEMDNRIISVLEAEGYMVFAGASQVMTEEMADKLRPALIYIMPLAANVNGFEPCRKIHTIPKLKNVPIVLLASLKGKIEAQHTEYYGIVDFLSLNFTAEELIAKTVAHLSSTQPSAGSVEEEFLPADEPVSVEEPFSIEEPLSIKEPPPVEKSDVATKPPTAKVAPTIEQVTTQAEKENPKIAATDSNVNIDNESPWEDEAPTLPPAAQVSSARTFRRRTAQQPSRLPWLLGILIVVLLAGGGFMAYEHFMSSQELPVSLTKKAVAPALPEQKAAESTPAIAPVAPAPEPAAQSQAPAPAPQAVNPAPAIPKKPSYAVQVGAFRTEEIAAGLVKKLQGMGYEAYAQKGVTKDNSPIIRVLIGNFPDRKAAVRLANEIQSKEQIKTTIFAY